MAFSTRLALMINAIKNHPNSIIIVERSLITDKEVFAKMLYDSGLIDHMAYQIYLNLFVTCPGQYMTSKTIYIKTSPEVCFKRISTRRRDGENNISLDYLSKCMKYHDQMIDTYMPNNLILDGDIDCTINTQQSDIWAQDIIKFVTN